MPILAHTNDNRECAEAQTDSMADIKSYNPEKRNKSKKISTYEIEQRNTGAARRAIPSSKSRVHCGYQAGKNKFWKEFCNLTSATNPWNAIYKMAGKTKEAAQVTTQTTSRVADNKYPRHPFIYETNSRRRTTKKRTPKLIARPVRW